MCPLPAYLMGKFLSAMSSRSKSCKVYWKNKFPLTLTDIHRFTTRGKVALAFSCLSGILGVIVVAWYGLAPEPAAAHPEGGDGQGLTTEATVVAKHGSEDGSVDATGRRVS